MSFPESPKIAIIGQGYVGLPLAVEFSRHFTTVGFDIDRRRIEELGRGHDHTLEISDAELVAADALSFSAQEADIADAQVYIVTVPTPIDNSSRPDLRPLISASEMLGRVIKTGDIVIYESTVYPGCTEEDCIPVIEQGSGLVFNRDFFAGYSPERINPGDKQRRLSNILKITSGSTREVADYVDDLYRRIVKAGTHRAGSIKVAEAAKVIENTQRDLNIALVNELALIFSHLGIDTLEVLEAAGTKWNFLPFRPGLVGGHCISVDPNYLAFKAQQAGYLPEVIISGRRVNEEMGRHIASTVVKMMIRRRIHVAESRVLVMGLSFKEDCPDIRNTGVINIIQEFQSYQAVVDVYDPWVEPEEAEREYGLALIDEPEPGSYDAIILCVAHRQFKAMSAADIHALGRPEHILYDVKYLLAKEEVDARL